MQNLPARGTILPLAFVTAPLKPANLPSGVSGARVTQCNNGLPDNGAGLTNGTVNKFGISGQEDGAKFVNNGMDFFTSVFAPGACSMLADGKLLSERMLLLTVTTLGVVLGTSDATQVFTSCGTAADVSTLTAGRVDTREETTPQVCGSGLIPNPPMFTTGFLRCSGGKQETAGKKHVSDDVTSAVLLRPPESFTLLCTQEAEAAVVDKEWNVTPVVVTAMLCKDCKLLCSTPAFFVQLSTRLEAWIALPFCFARVNAICIRSACEVLSCGMVLKLLICCGMPSEQLFSLTESKDDTATVLVFGKELIRGSWKWLVVNESETTEWQVSEFMMLLPIPKFSLGTVMLENVTLSTNAGCFAPSPSNN